MVGLVLGIFLQVNAAAPKDSQPSSQVRVQVTPDTVLVGRPFVVTIRVRVPRNVIVQFPAVPEAGAMVDTVGAVMRRDIIMGDSMESVATYPMAAWNLGIQPIQLGDLTIETPEGEIPLSFGAPRIIVRSVLPKDSSKHVPKAPRPLFPKYFDFWAAFRRWILPLLVLLAAILATIIGVRKWRRRQIVVEQKNVLSWAEQEFQRIEALRLLDHGEPELHAILMADVVRGYAVRQFSAARMSATTTELLKALHGETVVPMERMQSMYTRIDVLKFAAAPADGPEASAIGTESRAIVQTINEALDRARAAAADATASVRGTSNGASPREPVA